MLVPASKYFAVAEPGVCVSSTKSGKEYVAADFKITRGELAGEVVSWSGWLTDKAMDRTIASLRALMHNEVVVLGNAMGWVGDDISDLGELTNEVSITVDHDEYDGKTRARVAWVNPPKRALAADKMKALAERIRAKASGVPSVPGAPPVDVRDPFGD